MYGKLPVKHSGVMLSRLEDAGVIMFKCTYSALDVWSWLHKLTYKQLCIITKMQSWYHLHAAQNLSIIAEQEQRLLVCIQIHQEQKINEGMGEVCEAAVHLHETYFHVVCAAGFICTFAVLIVL